MRRTLDRQTRWNLAAQEVLEREIADDCAREDDAEWEANATLREHALEQAKSILGESK
jgi:hypothetical protein